MSGATSKVSIADHVPVRPAPTSTSSAMNNTSCSSQISRTRWKYSIGGTDAPVDDPPIGSAMNAATFSAPSRWIAAARCSALQASQSGAAPLHSHRYGYGAGICTTSISHSRKRVL
jgi:hypothetical protein